MTRIKKIGISLLAAFMFFYGNAFAGQPKALIPDDGAGKTNPKEFVPDDGVGKKAGQKIPSTKKPIKKKGDRGVLVEPTALEKTAPGKK